MATTYEVGEVNYKTEMRAFYIKLNNNIHYIQLCTKIPLAKLANSYMLRLFGNNDRLALNGTE